MPAEKNAYALGDVHDAGLAAGAGGDDLIVDPAVGFLHAVAQPRARLPAKHLLDERVVGVASVHAFRRIELVVVLEFDARDFLQDIGELVDAHLFQNCRY